LKKSVAAGMSGAGSRASDYGWFGAWTRLFGESLKDSDYKAVSGQNSSGKHRNHCERKDEYAQ
jgi:hypothetical protein